LDGTASGFSGDPLTTCTFIFIVVALLYCHCHWSTFCLW